MARIFYLIVVGVLIGDFAQGQDPIVLRDLTVIKDKPIQSFDETGVLLDGGETLGWDQILKAKVSPDQQQSFDGLLKEIGLPVFRLKTRIAYGDWGGAGEIAEPLFDAMLSGEKNPDPQTGYLISLAAMKSRLYSGDRARAAVAFLRTTTLQKQANAQTLELVQDSRLSESEIQTQMSDSILPVWFDPKNLETQIENFVGEIDERPGAMVYLASLRIELEQFESAEMILGRISNFNDPAVKPWRFILEARLLQKQAAHERARKVLIANSKQFVGPSKILARYYQSLNCLEGDVNDQSNASDSERSRSILDLLSIPAIYSKQYPYLSAAALFHSVEIAKLRMRPEEEQKLRRELLKRYPQTYHGRLLGIGQSNQSLNPNEIKR